MNINGTIINYYFHCKRHVIYMVTGLIWKIIANR